VPGAAWRIADTTWDPSGQPDVGRFSTQRLVAPLLYGLPAKALKVLSLFDSALHQVATLSKKLTPPERTIHQESQFASVRRLADPNLRDALAFLEKPQNMFRSGN
jgi:hypothetical protein